MSLQLEMISCGDCPKCLAGGKVHGPYWYRYYRRNGKMISEYVGKVVGSKDATDKIPEGSTPKDLYPERVERMRADAKVDAQARWDALPEARRTVISSIVGMQATARRAYRRSRKADIGATEIAAALDEQHQLKERIGEQKASLRQLRAAEIEATIEATPKTEKDVVGA